MHRIVAKSKKCMIELSTRPGDRESSIDVLYANYRCAYSPINVILVQDYIKGIIALNFQWCI
jgi:hypothetical protein